jgi:hypothetical protein
LAAQTTIVYADLDTGALQRPSAVAETLVRAAEESLTAGQFDVALRPLSIADVVAAIEGFPTGHARLSLDTNLILLDAGAMLAYAPYRALSVVTCDPFAGVENLSRTLGMSADPLRVRLHDSLVSADRLVAIGQPAFDAIAALVSRTPERRMFPPTPLRTSQAAQAPILVVGGEDEQVRETVVATVSAALPGEEFASFDPATVFDRPWKAVLHIGLAESTLPGGRLGDAWAGGVPVLQLVDPLQLSAQRRRHPEKLAEIVVEHGRTGLLSSTADHLAATLGEMIVDPLPARAVARGARRRIDSTAEWDAFLKALLQ